MAKRPDRLAEVIAEIEELAKRLRMEVMRAARKAGLTKNLERAAKRLRKRAAVVAGQVEKYAHELRMELVKGTAARRKGMRRKSIRVNAEPSTRSAASHV